MRELVESPPRGHKKSKTAATVPASATPKPTVETVAAERASATNDEPVALQSLFGQFGSALLFFDNASSPKRLRRQAHGSDAARDISRDATRPACAAEGAPASPSRGNVEA